MCGVLQRERERERDTFDGMARVAYVKMRVLLLYVAVVLFSFTGLSSSEDLLEYVENEKGKVCVNDTHALYVLFFPSSSPPFLPLGSFCLVRRQV